MQAVKIPSLDEHKPYHDAIKKSQKTARQLEELVAEAGAANRDGYGQYERGQIVRGQELQNEVRSAEFDAKIEGQTAASLARATIEASGAYRAQIAADVKEDVDHMAAALARATTIHEAGAKGISLTPLRTSRADEIRELVAYVGQLQRMGLLETASIPPALRPLLPPAPVVEALP